MKTKTGQFLMQHNKSKIPYQIPVSQSKSERAQILTPLKQQKNACRQQSKEKIKNKQGQQQEKNTHLYEKSYQREIQLLKDENKVLCEEIDRLKRQCTSLKTTVDERNHKNQKNSLSEQKQNIESTKNSSNKKQFQLSEQQQQQFILMEQKLRNLQIQNYRLIESNYVLLIRLRKNMKQYKDSLLKISNMLENLQFAEASREIYGILGGIKGEEGWVEGQIGEIRGFENQEKDLERKKEQERKKLKQQSEKLIRIKKLQMVSGICHESHFPHSNSLIDLENSIQLNFRQISSPDYRQQSKSYQLIEQPIPSKKLFSSEFHEVQRSPGVKQLADWENGQGNGSIIKRTVYKCHGNSTQLYKMLFLQAAAIQGFFS